MGLAAALVSVYGGRTLSLGLSSAQESISFYGFLLRGWYMELLVICQGGESSVNRVLPQ